MCGIVAVLSRPPGRRPPAGSEILGLLAGGAGGADAVRQVTSRLAGPAGLSCLVQDAGLRAEVAAAVRRLGDDEALADAIWSIREDRLATAAAVADLLGADAPEATEDVVAGWWAIQVALSALDRLEVRGRDSAGVAVMVISEDSADGFPVTDPLGRSGSRWRDANVTVHVHKTATEVGELGDNTRVLRAALAGDDVLRAALAQPGARCVVLAHTRWASVGLITEPNAHPVASLPSDGEPWVLAAVNGDIDNYGAVVSRFDLSYPAAVTTDARVVPGLARRLRNSGQSDREAFAAAVASFEGSHAIVSLSSDNPGELLLARRGSGQALYVGLAPDAFVVASEPYGLVEQTGDYLRFDTAESNGTEGEIVRLRASAAGEEPGVDRWSYDGAELTLPEVTRAEITTRDIDRSGFPHFLLKEISESPASFAKTLAGRIAGDPGDRRVILDGVLPAGGELPRRIVVIGQGTAAVAARAVAEVIGAELSGTGVEVVSRLASELSGFDLRDDMSDHLVVAISQSGTTTDTNRTVDLVQARGAWVTAVVNRRESDLAARADGVLYTSDGRDVEMSVASTKAFYAQVAAGFLLACAVADLFGVPVDPARRSEFLGALERLPEAMAEVLAARPRIADIAQRLAPSRRHWATVGNGRNRLAAEEVRIKLSELCYRSVACDITEDKKHVDLSAEPLTLVCAAGLDRSTARDVAKEVAIYAAHRGAPVTFTDDAELARAAGESVLLPAVHPDLAFVLATMAGHLFGYEAALAIDACAEPLRRTRGAIEAALDAEPDGAVTDAEAMLAALAPAIAAGAEQFGRRLRDGGYDGHLPAATALRLDALFRYALGVLPLASFEIDFGEMGTPAGVLERLLGALSEAIEELTRPVDAIRHQAKTVTVGISRSEEALLQVPLTEAVQAAGARGERLSYETLSTLAGLDQAVARITGHVRYIIDGERVEIADRSGVGASFESRVGRDPTLRGTKRQVSRERRVLLTRGLRDGRLILLVPEIKGGEVVGLVLLHVELRERLEPAVAADVLRRYRDRFSRLRYAVTETEASFDEALLAEVPTEDLLVGDIGAIAARWRGESA
ncbi:MAG: SIS domain-containing protein [Acidimicrobiia bacterium]|nr:SIS domain-containing protein [Acidimicrobiia bacterium]